MPLLTSSLAIPSVSPGSTWIIPFNLGNGRPSSSKIDFPGCKSRSFVWAETKSTAGIQPPWLAGGRLGKICARVCGMFPFPHLDSSLASFSSVGQSPSPRSPLLGHGGVVGRPLLQWQWWRPWQSCSILLFPEGARIQTWHCTPPSQQRPRPCATNSRWNPLWSPEWPLTSLRQRSNQPPLPHGKAGPVCCDRSEATCQRWKSNEKVLNS